MYHFLLGHTQTWGFNVSATENLFSAAENWWIMTAALLQEGNIWTIQMFSLVVLFAVRRWSDLYNLCFINWEIIEGRWGLIHDDKEAVVEDWLIIPLMFRVTNFLVVLCSTVSNWFIYTSSWNLLSHRARGTCPSALLIMKLLWWEFCLLAAVSPSAQIRGSVLKSCYRDIHRLFQKTWQGAVLSCEGRMPRNCLK